MAGRFTLSIFLDPDDLARLRKLYTSSTLLDPYYRKAMGESLDVVEYEAQNYMYATFQNTTGRLENAFEKYVLGPDEASLENDEPYARRRNYGFTGQTDSLGRYYPWDGGIAWAETAVTESFVEVEDIWQFNIDQALGRL